jgi:hypothetical protein
MKTLLVAPRRVSSGASRAFMTVAAVAAEQPTAHHLVPRAGLAGRPAGK